MENLIELNGNLKDLHIENVLIKTVIDEISLLFPNKELVRNNTFLILQICIAIEDIVFKHKLKKINKLELFFKIYSGIFGNISENDKHAITSTIDYLWRKGEIIITPLSKKIIKWFKKKFLV